ncbi:MAG: heavy metal translocating P-type ATPase [Castellaniella sp.]|uniref:heavy metal translocating P-type ATPase n=4 Tax=Castellaniella sp. TaxID=1955812 RepID=UPI003C774E1B
MHNRWHTALALFFFCLAGLLGGGILWLANARELASQTWMIGSIPALVALLHGIWTALRRREAGVDVLALISIAGALFLRQELTASVIAVMLASGRLLEGLAERRAGREMSALLERAPRSARCYRDGTLVEVPLSDIRAGDRLLVRQGEIIAADGTTITEHAVIDESALTGEALPVTYQRGDPLRSGSVNAGDAFEMVATATAANSTFSGIVKLVEAAQRSKAPATRLADRYALWFVPLSLGVAGAAWLISGDPLRALAVVVVATPCPLILAVPVAVVSAISRCAQRGILVKGGGALEALAATRNLFFDKTGTLTDGRARLIRIDRTAAADRIDDTELLRLAASLEQMSHHVIAGAVVAAARARALTLGIPSDVSEIPGAGVSGTLDGLRLVVGAHDYVARAAAVPPPVRDLLDRTSVDGTAAVLVAIDGQYAGTLLLADSLRVEAPRALRLLRRTGVRHIVMLTGDRREVAETVAAGLNVDQVLAEQTPADKLAAIKAARDSGTTVMVGDGINDAPALAAATVGVAMGARGATASAEAADIVLLADRLDRLAEALHIARQTRRIAMQSVFAGMGFSLLAMLAAAFGFLAPVYGALVQEAIDVAVIINALRVLRIRPLRAARYRMAAGDLERLHAEHQRLAPVLEHLDAAIDRLPSMSPEEALPMLTELDTVLKEQLLPHESADDRDVYPAIAGLLGGDDPMAAMSHAHREIFRLHRSLGAGVTRLAAQPQDRATLYDLQRILHALDAILRLHFAQEEEIYQSVAED